MSEKSHSSPIADGLTMEAAEDPKASLRLRVISACVLAPFAVVSIWLGGIWLVVVAAVMGGLMSYEWVRQVAPKNLVRILIIYCLAIGFALAACLSGAPDWAFFFLLSGAAACGGIGLVSGRLRFPGLAALGVFYIGYPALVLVDLSFGLTDGTAVLLWLFALVWATDTGAYLVGRRFGRLPLLPQVSPNKTWEGLGGGLVAAMAVGIGAAPFVELGGPLQMAIASAALSVIAQAGDFTESAFKRHFGVKDMSGFVPGHGGLLDRLDGLLSVLIAAGIVRVLWTI